MNRTLTKLPPAGREQQLAHWSLEDTARRVEPRQGWSSYGDGGYDDDGVVYAPHQGAASRTGLAPEIVDFLRGYEGGWTIVDPERDGRESGMVAHRGALHPGEHVDHERLVALVEAELGFTFDELHSVYSTGGRILSDLRGLRGRIDARLLALSRSGANMDLFSRVTGVTPRTVDRALARARKAEEAAP